MQRDIALPAIRDGHQLRTLRPRRLHEISNSPVGGHRVVLHLEGLGPQRGVRAVEVVGWGEVRAQRPDLAAHVQSRMTAICYLATVRPDGLPRVHPVGLNFDGDRILVPMTPTSPKGHDLRRNGRFAAHCTVEDTQGGGGEVLLTGTAREVDATEDFRARGWVAFELHVGEILSIAHASEDDRLVVERWQPTPRN